MSTTSMIMMIIVAGSYFIGFAYLLYKASKPKPE
jgi:hypothetical protein